MPAQPSPLRIPVVPGAVNLTASDLTGEDIVQIDNGGPLAAQATLNALGTLFGESLLVTAAGGTEPRTLPAHFKDVINVLDYGADGTDEAFDNLAAFQEAAAATPINGVFRIPPGTYALSDTFVFSQYRCVIQCDGLIVPHASNTGGDFLISFKGTGTDPLIPAMSLCLQIDRLHIDGRYRNRGVRFEKWYNASTNGVRVWREYGTAVALTDVQECSWHGLVISGGIRRTADWAGSETDYDIAASYVVGDIVRPVYPEWDIATAYTALSLVQEDGLLYRAIFPSTGVLPSPNYSFWQRIPHEYFECMIPSVGKDPNDAANYTTNSPNIGDHYWKQIYREEAALELVNSTGVEIVDNQWFFGINMRCNSHKVQIRMDNLVNARKIVNIAFFGGMIHGPFEAYIAAVNAPPQNAGMTPMNDSVMIEFGRTQDCKFIDVEVRSGDSERNTMVQWGAINPAKTVQDNQVIYCDFSGEGDGQYGQCVMPGVTFGQQQCLGNKYQFSSGATSPRQVGDTSRLVAYRTERDMIPATVPANFSPTHRFLILDAAGNPYWVAAAPPW